MAYAWKNRANVNNIITQSLIFNEIQTAINTIMNSHCPSNYTSVYNNCVDCGSNLNRLGHNYTVNSSKYTGVNSSHKAAYCSYYARILAT